MSPTYHKALLEMDTGGIKIFWSHLKEKFTDPKTTISIDYDCIMGYELKINDKSLLSDRDQQELCPFRFIELVFKQ